MQCLLNINQAAEKMNVAPKTIRNWMSTGKMQVPYVKIGDCVRFRESDIDRYVEAHLVKPKCKNIQELILLWMKN